MVLDNLTPKLCGHRMDDRMMTKALILFLFLTGAAYGAYSPSTIITDPAGVNQATVKAASTAPTATDKALVVAMSPNSSCSVTGTFWQATQPVSIASMPTTPVTGTFWQATQPVSAASLPLPSGAATSANQTTGNTSLATIATNTGKAPINTTAAFSQTSVTTTASTISAPTNAVKVMIQGDSANTDCVRYRFDGTAATSTVGMVAQPGQDSGQLDSGMSVSVAACSGTQKVNVQYFAQ